MEKASMNLLCVLIAITGVVSTQYRMSIETIPVNPPFKVGFGGVWDSRTTSMYFVDHYSNNSYRYALDEGKTYTAAVETNFTICFMFPSKQFPNIFFVGAGNTIILVRWNGHTETAEFVKILCEVEPGTGNIMNHAVAGPQGEFIFGTFALRICGANATQGLYQYKKHKSHSVVKTLLSDVVITSGVAIDEESNILYHLDGCRKELTAYDRDYNTGDLFHKRVVIKFNFPGNTLMVGLVIDSNKNLYTGVYGAAALIRINTKTRTYRSINMPTKLIGDPGFGGRNNDELFVASGTNIPNFSTGQPNATILTPPAGSVFKMRLGARSKLIRFPTA